MWKNETTVLDTIATYVGHLAVESAPDRCRSLRHIRIDNWLHVWREIIDEIIANFSLNASLEVRIAMR